MTEDEEWELGCEAYEEGRQEGLAEASGAAVEVTRAVLRWLAERGLCDGSDGEEGYTADQAKDGE